MNNKNTGWVKLWRDQFNHEISERKPWCDGYAWSYLYSRANFRPAIVNFRNQYIPVERGQFVTSELKLSKIFGWSRRRTKAFLIMLKSVGMCDNRRTQRFLIITICNYEKFQSQQDDDRTTDVTIDGTTDAQQKHTDKNEKNEKKKTSRDFSSEISVLKERYFDQEIIDQAFKAIQSTRKSNRISDSVRLSILQGWERQPVESVMNGIKTYLDKSYHHQGKDEKYLLGIIRNSNGTGTIDAPQDQIMRSTGSPALDEHYRSRGFRIT